MADINTSYFADYLGSIWNTAATANGDPEFAQPRTSQTATMNALQSAQPIDNGSGNAWSSWLKGVGDTLINYAVVKDITRTQASVQTQAQLAQSQAAANAAVAQRAGAGLTISPGLLMMAGFGVLVFLVARKA
jgi:hypothetical protein